MRLKAWHCLSLLFLATLLAYYPSLHAGYNSVDDLKMITGIEKSGPVDLARLFVQSRSYYYRPLTILSYSLDRDIWGSVASFMHLQNILLHLTCALLVYAITRKLAPFWQLQGRWPALFAGLFFALHPVATEPVAWISGRTDLLMTAFLLLAVWLTLVGLASGRAAAFAGAAVALIMAALAKEVAVFVLPGLLWLIAVYPGEGGVFARVRRRWRPLAASSGAIAAYFVLRMLAIGHETGIRTALKGVTGGAAGQGLMEMLDKCRVAFKVYGFYFKKLFIPWPLSFGIVEISDWYVLAGVVLAGVLLYLAWRADLAGAFGLMAFCVLSPALLVVFGQMAWAPLAERYLYASLAMFAPLATLMALSMRAVLTGAYRYRGHVPLVLLLLVFFISTLHRAWIWQDNLRLYRDSVAKSPGFLPARVELASALVRRGQEDEAKAILEGMQSSSRVPDFVNDDLNLAAIRFANGDFEGAREILLPLLDKNPKKRFDVLQHLLRVNDRRVGRAETAELKLAIQRESLAWLEEQQRLQPSAFISYRIGKLHLSMGNKAEALAAFRKSLLDAPNDAHYRAAAMELIEKLESG